MKSIQEWRHPLRDESHMLLCCCCSSLSFTSQAQNPSSRRRELPSFARGSWRETDSGSCVRANGCGAAATDAHRAMEGEEEIQPSIAMPPWLSTEWRKLQHEVPRLVITIAVLVVALLFLSSVTQFAFRRKKSKTVLLVGLNDAGKTALFYQLKDGTTHQGAVTSMEPNEGTFVLHSETTKKGSIKPVHIVDVPGHPKLRPQLEELLPKACCLVFLIDALDFMPHKEAAAEYLYDILTNKEVVKRKVPLLLTCNKMDKVTAHSSNFIRGQLEKELNKLRKSRIAISAADVSSEIYLGVEGDIPFNFTQCSNKVTIAEISALGGNVEQVEQFIREHVKQ